MHHQLFQLTENLVLFYLNNLDSKTKQHERLSYYLVLPYLPVTSAEFTSNACKINNAFFPAEDNVPLMFSVIEAPSVANETLCKLLAEQELILKVNTSDKYPWRGKF